MGPDTPLCGHALSLAVAKDAGATGIFLLADQSALPRIVSLWPGLSQLRWKCLLTSGVAQPDGATPLLVDVSEVEQSAAQRRVLNDMYAHGRWANCLSLLVSKQCLDSLAGALIERTQAELPHDLRVCLRYFDTRALPLLVRLFTQKQYGAFMGCVESWHFVDRWGLLQTMPAPEFSDASAAYSSLVIDSAQERMLIDDGTTDFVIDQLLEQRHPAFAGVTPPEQYDMISEFVAAANASKIEELRGVFLYCCAALAHGTDFDHRSPWAERLGQHFRGSMTLEEALADDR